MRHFKLPCAMTLLLLGTLLCASNASAGGLTRWPAGDVVVYSADGSKVVVALDQTGDGVSEHLLVLTADRGLKPFSASGHARIVVKDGQLLFLTPGLLESTPPALLPIRFTHLAEYGGSQGKVRLDALERGDARLDSPAKLYGDGDGGPLPEAGPCALTCSVSCNDGTSCSITGCPANKCASCSCGGCSCTSPTS